MYLTLKGIYAPHSFARASIQSRLTNIHVLAAAKTIESVFDDIIVGCPPARNVRRNDLCAFDPALGSCALVAFS